MGTLRCGLLMFSQSPDFLVHIQCLSSFQEPKELYLFPKKQSCTTLKMGWCFFFDLPSSSAAFIPGACCRWLKKVWPLVKVRGPSFSDKRPPSSLSSSCNRDSFCLISCLPYLVTHKKTRGKIPPSFWNFHSFPVHYIIQSRAEFHQVWCHSVLTCECCSSTIK